MSRERFSSVDPTRDRKTHFICLHRSPSEGSYSVALVEYGFSNNIAVGDRADVGRSLTRIPCPPTENFGQYYTLDQIEQNAPIAFADPGSAKTVVTPPETLNLYASSCVFNPSRAPNHW